MSIAFVIAGGNFMPIRPAFSTSDISSFAMNAMITALGNGWETPKAAPDQTVTPAVQEAMYDAIFGVMQGTYSPKDALKNMDSAAAN